MTAIVFQRLLVLTYFGVLAALLFGAISEQLFKPNARRCATRIALAIIWPFALLSQAGRDLLFTSYKKIQGD